MQRKVKIKLDKVRHLKYTWGAIRRLKEDHDVLMSSIERIAEDWTLFGPWMLEGLRHEDEELTLDMVESFMPLTPTGAALMAAAIVEALGAAEQSDAPADPTTGTPQSTTGVNSIK